MDFGSVLKSCGFASAYVAVLLLSQAIFEEFVLPRLNFSKTSPLNLRQMLVRWILFSKRLDFNFKRDLFLILQVSLLMTALSVLPINGESGLRVERPDLAIALIMMIFYFLRVIYGWRSLDKRNWEKALEEMLFASSRVLVFLLILAGTYLASTPGQFQNMLGADGLAFSGVFHFFAFVGGILMVSFFQGRQEYRESLTGLALLSWKIEPLVWLTLLLVTFLNTAATPGAPYFFALLAKCLAIVFLLDLIRSHMPKIRMDQVERVGLRVIFPLAIVIFFGLWWSEVMG